MSHNTKKMENHKLQSRNYAEEIGYIFLCIFTYSFITDTLRDIYTFSVNLLSISFLLNVLLMFLLTRLVIKIKLYKINFIYVAKYSIILFLFFGITHDLIPILSIVNLNNHFPKVVLLDDAHWQENPYDYGLADGEPSDYFFSGSSKVFIPYDDFKNDERSKYISEFEYEMNIKYSSFPYYPYIAGYSKYGEKEKIYDYGFFFLAYLGHFIFENMFYVFILTLVTFIMHLRNPGKILEIGTKQDKYYW